jgi:hypothetical protein
VESYLLHYTEALNRATSTRVGDHLGIPPVVCFCLLCLDCAYKQNFGFVFCLKRVVTG